MTLPHLAARSTIDRLKVVEDAAAVAGGDAPLPAAERPEQSCSDLYRQFGDPLKSFFRRRRVPPSEVDDLAQDVFSRIAGKLAREPIDLSASYVFTIAANLLRDRGRKFASSGIECGSNVVLFPGRPSGEGLIDALEPERVLLSREKLACVLAGLDHAPPRTRDVFLLFRLDGMKQREIADLYGISVSAVEKHVVKGVECVERALRRYNADRY